MGPSHPVAVGSCTDLIFVLFISTHLVTTRPQPICRCKSQISGQVDDTQRMHGCGYSHNSPPSAEPTQNLCSTFLFLLSHALSPRYSTFFSCNKINTRDNCEFESDEMTSRECGECGRLFACSPNYRGDGASCPQAVTGQTIVHPSGRYRQAAKPTRPRGAEGYGPARGCIAY